MPDGLPHSGDRHMLQRSFPLASDRTLRFLRHTSVSQRSDFTQYQMNLENPRVEQVLESTIVIDWQAQTQLNELQDQVNALQNQVVALAQDYQKLREVLRGINQGAVRLDKIGLNIAWDHVRSVVEAATFELNWDVQISINTSENLVILTVKEEQDDLIAETTFDFYSSVITQLGHDIFKEIHFVYVSDSDD